MYYIDRYLGCLVEEKDCYSPPERYYEYRCGRPGIVTEAYIVNSDPLRTIVFNRATHEDLKTTVEKRTNFFKENNVTEDDLILQAYIVPPEWYEWIIEKYMKHKEK